MHEATGLPADRERVSVMWPQSEPPRQSGVLDSLERFSQLLDQLHDTPHAMAVDWEGNVAGVACRRLERLINGWRSITQHHGPPTELIVRIAKRLAKIVEDLGRNPRKVLQRQRVMTPIDRMRELDVACAQWLTRQPGRNLVEKTGNKRSLLAVQRFESVDTLENRVFVNVLQSSAQLARQYLWLYTEEFPDHEYIHRVRNFLRLCQQVLGQLEFQNVARLTAIPKPNYALLHEPRYRQVWWAYEQLIRQHVRRRQLWEHRWAAWSEMCQIALMASLTGDNSLIGQPAQDQALSHDVWIEEKTRHGRRLINGRWAPNWADQRNHLMVICRGEEIEQALGDLPRAESHELIYLLHQPLNVSDHTFTLLSPDLSVESLRSDCQQRETDTISLQVQRKVSGGKWSEHELLEVPANLTLAPHFFDTHVSRWLSP